MPEKPSIIVAIWAGDPERKDNWGDKLNKQLIHRLSKLPVVHVGAVLGWGDRPVYRVIGSALAFMRPNEVVWGQGFSDRTAVPGSRAASIRAVRGPLTRARLLELGIPCPEVYGDPAVLCPLFWQPEVEPRYDYGIIQHFREADAVKVPAIRGDGSVKVIDIRGTIRDVIEDILSCRAIISSSLHGVIAAHAYGRPAWWLKASDLPVGDDLKYHDYFASIGHARMTPATIDAEGFVDLGDSPSMPVAGALDADALLRACPFIDDDRRRVLIDRRRALKAEGHTGTIF